MRQFVWLGTLALSAPALAVGSSFGTAMVNYAPGVLADTTYTNPFTAVGSPERFTGEVFNFTGAVTPFNPAFGPDEIVSIGGGGHLTLAFDHDVLDDPQNPYGFDFLAFGNAGFIDVNWPHGHTTPGAGMFGVGSAALVHVSIDGLDWRPVLGQPDAMFPTLGYADLTDPYALLPGGIDTDFTKPVNPALTFGNSTFAAISAAYDGSGGGAGFDISGTGLPFIRFVRFSNPASDASAFEIDAISDVSPVPSPVSLVPLALFVTAWHRRRAHVR